MSKKKFPKEEAIKKLAALCAIQERSQFDIQQKLKKWGFYYHESQEIIADLINLGFLNEERFTVAFVRGKFNQKKWGKQKIAFELKQKFIPNKLIDQALSRIPDVEYQKVLRILALKKLKLISEPDNFKKSLKLKNFLVSKGYEFDIINEVVNELIKQK